MFPASAQTVSKARFLRPGLVMRGYRGHKVNTFRASLPGGVSSGEGRPEPESIVGTQKDSTKPLRGTTVTSKSPSVEKALHPSVSDPSTERSMRMTQALSPELMSHLSPTFQKFTLNGKVAIVTGGARGLGLNMVQAICESGIKAVAIFDIQPTLGASMAQALSASTGIPIKYYNVDVTDEAGVETAVDDVVQDFGGVDILINSAGVAFSNIPAEAYMIDDFEKTVNINLTGSFRVAKAVGRHMIAATPESRAASASASTSDLEPEPADRSIILIASMSGSIVNYPQPQCAYNASKAGVIQLGKSLAAEWCRYGIRVNTVSPGYMDTALNQLPILEGQKVIWKERTPMGRLGKVEELNNLVVWLAGEGSRFCTGTDLRIDGGYSAW